MIIDIIAYTFGHKVIYDQESSKWFYVDDDGKILAESTKELKKIKKCPKCGLKPTENGHDPCIANLKDVDYACCGHGIEDFKQAYIKYSNGKVIRFKTTDKMHKYLNNKKCQNTQN